MKKQEFIDFLKSPETLSKESISSLEQLVHDFPYFQTADILYTLNLSKENSIKFNNQLKIASAYAPDRKLLKQLIKSVQLLPSNENNNIERESNASEINEEKTTATELESPQLNDEDLYLPHLIDIFQKELDKITDITKDSTEFLHLKNLAGRLENLLEEHIEQKNSHSRHYFEEYNLSHLENESKPEEKSNASFELIDKFIKENPKIISQPPTDFFDPVDFAKQSLIDNDEIVSETLAKIYYRQGNIAKALKIYKKLSLLNPEKRFYFAGLIEKIQKEIK